MHQELEIGFVPFPEPVQDHPRQRPYLPFMFIAIDTESKLAVHHDLIHLHQSAEIIQEAFMQFIAQLDALPSVILMDDVARANDLKPVTDKLEIHVNLVEELEEVYLFTEEMMNAIEDGLLNDQPF
ncbi:DUF6930 domain-containing protein [Gracilibacillus boraciitolerans]